MLSLVTHWARVDDAELGRPKLSGQDAANPLAVPMMLLYVIDEVCRDDEELRQTYSEDEDWAVQQLLKHLQVKLTFCVFWLNFHAKLLIPTLRRQTIIVAYSSVVMIGVGIINS